ncbi:MAG TPA: choice-of-anchor tandem repeat GloVer-containing protein [Candidatus Cybelea sp.]|jgi:uncharacterized repeat protein (TIGR03803 family)
MAERTRATVTYGVLYSFKGGSDDGENPYAGLINVGDALYGTTADGGTNGTGTVFAITKTGRETVIHRFGGSGDGANPYAGLLNIKGTLYGTTFDGGTNKFGTVFAIDKHDTETVLHSFGAPGDGVYPEAALINVGGTLYGTTADGGTNSVGTVFAITKAGMEIVLHSFSGGSQDGAVPYAGLLDVEGTLYGTAQYGGANDAGIVFAITTNGAVTVLHSFGGPGDGGYPLTGLVKVNGTLYGTTVVGGASCGQYHLTGCGVVFSITQFGQEKVLHSFGGSGDGVYPYAGLLNVKGTLYGTTAAGGANCSPYGCGVVFSITPSGKERVLHSFGGSGDGAYSGAALLNVKDTLYGTTVNGGTNGNGTVFSLRL